MNTSFRVRLFLVSCLILPLLSTTARAASVQPQFTTHYEIISDIHLIRNVILTSGPLRIEYLG